MIELQLPDLYFASNNHHQVKLTVGTCENLQMPTEESINHAWNQMDPCQLTLPLQSYLSMLLLSFGGLVNPVFDWADLENVMDTCFGESANQPVDQPNDHMVDESFTEHVIESIDALIQCKSVHGATDMITNNPLSNHETSPSISQPNTHSLSQSFDQSIDQPFEQSSNYPTSHRLKRSISHTNCTEAELNVMEICNVSINRARRTLTFANGDADRAIELLLERDFSSGDEDSIKHAPAPSIERLLSPLNQSLADVLAHRNFLVRLCLAMINKLVE